MNDNANKKSLHQTEEPRISNNQETSADEAIIEQVTDKPAKSAKKTIGSLKKMKEALEQTQAENISLKADIDQLKDQNLRLLAEFDNYRKRRVGETLQAAEYTKREIILALLPVLDDANRLFQHQNNNGENLTGGIKMIAEKLLKIFQEMGLQAMELEGAHFDPEKHEALMMVEKPDTESGVIVEVYEPGYMLNDTVLRHAKVIVNK